MPLSGHLRGVEVVLREGLDQRLGPSSYESWFSDEPGQSRPNGDDLILLFNEIAWGTQEYGETHQGLPALR